LADARRTMTKKNDGNADPAEHYRSVFLKMTGRPWDPDLFGMAAPNIRRAADECTARSLGVRLRNLIEEVIDFAERIDPKQHKPGSAAEYLRTDVVPQLPDLLDVSSMRVLPDPAQDNVRTWFVQHWPGLPSKERGAWKYAETIDRRPRVLACAFLLLGWDAGGAEASDEVFSPVERLRKEERAFGQAIRRHEKELAELTPTMAPKPSSKRSAR
jgi:hypothetical protein